MLHQHTLLGLLLVACVSWQPVSGAEPADSRIKAALYDLERAEQQASQLTGKSPAKLRRIQQGLDRARQQLDASPNKSHASWTDTEQRINKLQQFLVSAGNKKSAPAQTKSPSAAAVRQSNTAGSVAGNSTATRQAAPRSSATRADRTTAGDQPADLNRFEKELLASIDRQVQSAFDRIRKVDPLDFSKAGVVQQWRREPLRLATDLQKVPHPNHPAVGQTGEKIIALARLVKQRIDHASQVEASLGDVKTNLAQIVARSRVKMPDRPQKPYTVEKVRMYAQQLNALSAGARQDHEYLQSVKGKTRAVLPSQIDSALAATGKSRQDYIRRQAAVLGGELKQQFGTADFFAGSVSKAKVQHLDRNLHTIYEAKNLLDVVDEFEQSANIEIIDTSQKRQSYSQAIAGLIARSSEALAGRRFPPVRSTDPALLDAAKTVLAKHGKNPISRMEITYDKQRKSVTEGEIDWGRVVSTVTVTGYEWDEFAVTTAEQVDGKHYLYYNLFKFFHKGGADVPTGRWTLAERRKHSEILADNITR